jgi:hypothetical protein
LGAVAFAVVVESAVELVPKVDPEDVDYPLVVKVVEAVGKGI